ncbi:MAG: DMT family transporter [Alphaproteobacteria bacterium]|nr:DMT family transporter [Alphaproteobacteria bacterium]
MPHLALVFAASVWGSAPAAIKFVLAAIPLFDAVAFRFLLATAALWLAALIAGRLGRVRQVGWQPFLAGMVDPGVIAVLVYHGVQMTTAIHTSVIFALMPIVSTVFGRAVLKEAISVPVVLGAGVAIAGIAVLVSSKTATGEPTLAGDLVIVGCVFIVCAAQLVLRKVARDHGEPIVATASMMSGATTTGFVAWLVFADDHSLTWAATAPADVWIVFLYAALVISAGCFFLYNYALHHLPVGRASLYGVLEGPSGVVIAWLLLGEVATLSESIGIGLAIAGVALPSLIALAWAARAGASAARP